MIERVFVVIYKIYGAQLRKKIKQRIFLIKISCNFKTPSVSIISLVVLKKQLFKFIFSVVGIALIL